MNSALSKSCSTQMLEPLELAPYLPQFKFDMESVGFTRLTIKGYVDAVGHFGTWLSKESISPSNIAPDTVERFAKHRCTCSRSLRQIPLSRKYVQRVRRFVDYLREIKVVNDRSRQATQLPSCWDQNGFSKWLICDRDLVDTTVTNCARALNQILPDLGHDVHQYTAKRIRRVVCEYAAQHGKANSQRLITALRSYLNFLVSKGLCSYSLIAAVPTIAHWRLSALPRYISVEEVERVIQSCDTEKAVGMRDHAVLLLLARLGLRASDVVNLMISDIDWNKATLLLRGKSRRASCLPLPQDAGDTILRYLEFGRVCNIDSERLFLCTTAPHRPIGGSQTVSAIVRAAMLRSGIAAPPSFGAHLLRHSAATGWIREGVSLEAISVILRHRSADMTMHYAKTDVGALSELAVTWPEGSL